MKLGIIGFGRLGRLITKYVAQDADVIVYEKFPNEETEKQIKELGGTIGTLEEACDCPIVIPFVPISEFEKTLIEMKPFLKAGTLVADVCSVKKHPIDKMLEILPKDIQILGTHPMFGPDSAKESLFGCKIVLCNERIDEKLYNDIKNYLNNHGLKVIESTADKHDEEISHSLLLTHFIGRTLMELGTSELAIDTKGYRRLMKILETVENDSWQLFVDMNKYNSYSESTREEFLESIAKVNKRITE